MAKYHKIKCPKCKKPVDTFGQFCPHCGTEYAYYGAEKRDKIEYEQNEKKEPLPEGDFFPQAIDNKEET